MVEEFLKEVKQNEEPFALMLCSNEPHEPWNKGDVSRFNPDEITLPPVFVDTKETRKAYCTYLAEIGYLDSQVGQALDLLEEYGFTDNTFVVFASEQGNSFPFAKWTLYEAGVKSALIARMPGRIKAGTQSEAIVEYSDLLPTFIELAGGAVREKLDGESLVPICNRDIEGTKQYAFSLQTTRGIIRGSEYYAIRSVVSDQYRYIWNLTPEEEFEYIVNNRENGGSAWYKSWVSRAVKDDSARQLITKYRKRPGEELYDIRNDQWCQTNLADKAEYQEIKKILRSELLKWMEECGDKGMETEMEAFLHMPKHNK